MKSSCSVALLESALAGNLPADDEGSLHQHLEECEACAAALERMAGGAAWRQEAESLLAADELDEAGPARDDWSEVDFTVEHLEPAGEPDVLGRLGGYDVLEVIGRGGMGIVLKGFDRELKRCVAIKVLAPHLAQSSLARKRFAREAQAAAAVVHPHVLAIHQVQPSGRLPFLVMPLVAGESLATRLTAQGALELKEMLRIGMQAAAGLAAAHEQGLVHRDVKPANILLEKGVERAVLTDFGLARAADDVALTRWGIIAGTPEYMSPEQARGEPLHGSSDLFSLGCVLYEMATGVSPFRTDSAMATMRRLVDDSPQSMASLNPELPPWFVAIVDRLLEKDTSRRFRSAKEVSELLEGCLAHVQQPANVPLPAGVPVVKSMAPATRPASHWSNRRRFGTMAAILLFSLIGFAAVLLLTDEPSDISGEWTAEGDDWGIVVLRQTGPKQYAGTYTDTLGNEKGKIELKWSRIERRYNGTWSEGQDRFGKISVRQVGDEIRGAFTTDRASKINPGTPELADLTWVRAKATDAPSRPSKKAPENAPSGPGKNFPESNWAFGPTFSRVMIFPSEPTFPGATADALRLADGKMYNLPKKAASDNEDLSPEKLEQWFNETKVNFVIDYRNDQWQMKLRNVKLAELAEIPSDSTDDWKTLGADELQARFSKLEWKKPTGAEKEQKETGFKSLTFTKGTEPPMTFAYETSDGHRGILQFFQSSDTLAKKVGPPKFVGLRRWASIRFKQLQQVDTPVNWRFGPTLDSTLRWPRSPDFKPRGVPTLEFGGEALRLADGKKFNLTKEHLPPEKMEQLWNETKVNLVIDYRKETGQWEMKLRNVKFAELAETISEPDSGWKTLSANELQARFSKLEWKKPTNAKKDQKGSEFKSLLFVPGMRPPVTFAFETSDGHRGILQFESVHLYRPDSSEWEATIRFKQLQRTDAPANGKGAAGPNWIFGPTLTRTLICPSTTGGKLFNRDGRQPAIEFAGEALRLEDGKTFSVPKKAASDKEGMSPEQLEHWFNETKVNLVIDYRKETDQWEMKLHNVKLADLPQIPSEPSRGGGPPDWKTLSADELQARFAKLEWKKPTNAEKDRKEAGFKLLLFPEGKKPPMPTFAFETSDGQRGVLQFYQSFSGGFGPRGPRVYGGNASIRFKQLKQADAPDVKGVGGSNWTFGPTVDCRLIPPSHDPAVEEDLRTTGEALRLEDGRHFRLPKKEEMPPEKLEQWLNETKVNLAIVHRSAGWELKLRNVKVAELAETPWATGRELREWRAPSANEVQAQFSKLEWKKPTSAEQDEKETGFKSLVLLEGTKPPMTFAYETSDGLRGMLQFTDGVIGAGGFINVRFKQLQQADTPDVKGAGGKNGPTSPAQPAVPAKSQEGPLEMKFVSLPKATFFMGGGGGKAGWKTEIKEDFEIAIFTVTQAQWQTVMGNNPSRFSRDGNGKALVENIKGDELKLFPVENVSWEAAQEFIKKLNEKEAGRGYLYRLPTGAEWEYACRGAATSQEESSFDFYFEKPTNEIWLKQANFAGDHPADRGPLPARPTKVGSYAPNKLGLYDMQGNVWQWCSDQEVRGGSWKFAGQFCRAANHMMGGRNPYFDGTGVLGLRLVRVPSGGEQGGKAGPTSPVQPAEPKPNAGKPRSESEKAP
jgi:serine/threonine protein kinase/formylglycine-generating enzyme required for sulfatase activity